MFCMMLALCGAAIAVEESTSRSVLNTFPNNNDIRSLVDIWPNNSALTPPYFTGEYNRPLLNWGEDKVSEHYQNNEGNFKPEITACVRKLNLQGVDFSQKAEMWDKLAKASLPDLQWVDVSNAVKNPITPDPCYFGPRQFLRELQENKTLMSLQRIDAKDCGIDALTILGFRDGFLARDNIHPDPTIKRPLIRDTLQISGKYDWAVAPFHFYVNSSEINELTEKLERYGQGIPVDKPQRIYDVVSVMHQGILKAYFQVIVQT